MTQVQIAAVRVAAPALAVPALEAFYGSALGLGWGSAAANGQPEPTLMIGSDTLSFASQADGAPFHHFALLVPGDRFAAAQAWLGAVTPLLARAGSTETTFCFENWDAQACYAHDPAANIIELIAHRGSDENGRSGPFTAAELCGISELGLVCADVPAAGAALQAAGLKRWDGTLSGDGLGFVGAKARTLILASPGRGWLPTGRGSEPHDAEARILGDAGEVCVRLKAGTLTAGR